MSSLNLADCNLYNHIISNDEITYLAHVLPRTDIAELDLRGLALKSEAARALAESLPMSIPPKISDGILEF